MNKKLIMLSLGLGLFLTGCQSDNSSENPEEVNVIQESQKEPKHDVNKWHVPPLTGFEEDGFRLHEAGFFQGALANCDTYPHYEGGEKLMVLEGVAQSYHGEVEVKNMEINDQLNLCGSIKVVDEIKVNYAGALNLGGEMIAGGDINVSYGGHLVIEGNVIVKGDLVVNKNAVLKFLGKESSIEVLGKAKIHKKAIIEGEFNDVSNKIK